MSARKVVLQTLEMVEEVEEEDVVVHAAELGVEEFEQKKVEH